MSIILTVVGALALLALTASFSYSIGWLHGATKELRECHKRDEERRRMEHA